MLASQHRHSSLQATTVADAATIVVVVAVVVAERTSNCNSTYYEEGLAFGPALLYLFRSTKRSVFVLLQPILFIESTNMPFFVLSMNLIYYL